MSQFHGPEHKGVMAERRKAKRKAAEDRNAKTPPARRRAARRVTP